MKRVLLLGVVLLFAAGCARHELRPDESERNDYFAQILSREDKRILGDDDFLRKNLLGNPYPEVREWCARALGRIGDTRALPWLYEALHRGDAPVRAASAFAVGQIEDRDLLEEQGLGADPQALREVRRLFDDASPSVQLRAIEAAGRMGAESEARDIAQRLGGLRPPKDPFHIALWDSAITALLRLRSGAAVLEKLLRDDNPEIQWRAANALIRLGNKGACESYLAMLESLNTNLQAYAARGLGLCGDPSSVAKLSALLPSRNDRGRVIPLEVRCGALQGLTQLKNPEAVKPIAAAIKAQPVDGRNPDQINFSIKAAEALGEIGSLEALPFLRDLLGHSGPIAQSAVQSLAKISKSDPELFYAAIRGTQFKTPPAIRALAVALSEVGGPDATEALKSLLAQSMETPQASLVVPTILTSISKINSPEAASLLNPFLTSRDGVILRSAVSALNPAGKNAWIPLVKAFSGISESSDQEAKITVIRKLAPWATQPDVQSLLRGALKDPDRNVRIAAGGVLRAAGAPDVPQDLGPSKNPQTDLTYLMMAEARKDRTVATIETGRGEIEIELFREDAPLTVANFVALAKRGFYDGLTFMRVVPFFVIQGGDPRNDQEGGPGYTIRCEINMRPFERGSVGMALSGKDTGGSQFFITLAPQPHLDGKYTCFGRVISGMPVAEAMVPGDVIRHIRIKEDVTMIDFRRF